MANFTKYKNYALSAYLRGKLKKKAISFIISIVFVVLPSLLGCRTAEVAKDSSSLAASSAAPRKADDYMIVDCMLPGQIRKLGRMVYQTPRRPVSTTAIDCEIRGGEYVAYDRAGYASALNVWLNLAMEGDKNAQTHVGEIYMKGLTGSPQYDKAVEWFQKAADQGYERAQLNLGYLFEMGLGVPRDSVKALNLYRTAAGLEESIVLESETITEAERQEMERLRLEVQQLRDETQRLRRSLDETSRQKEQSLKNHRQQMERLESERKALDRARQELSRLKAQLEESKSDPTLFQVHDTAEVEKLKKELAIREAELDTQRKRSLELENEISRLDEQAQSYQRIMKENQHVEDLQAKLEKQKSETVRLREMLDSAVNNEKALQKELESRKIQLDERQKELAETRQRLEAAQKAEGAIGRKEIDLLEAELARREEALAKEKEKAGRVSAEMNIATSEVEDYKNQLKEFEKLKSQMERQISENKELKELLEKTREEKARLAEEFAWKQEHLEAERRGLEKARASLENQDDKILSAGHDRLLKLEEEIARREKEMEKQKNEEKLLLKNSQELSQKVALYEKQMENLQKQMETLPNPSIEIIDPKLMVTRSQNLEARVETGLDYMEIIGKVNAPAGLYSLKVNEREEKWSEEGLFKVDLPVKKSGTSVKIVAVDSRGKAESILFTVIPGLSEAAKDTPKLDFGRYYALIIGNNNYQHFPNLQTAANDARDLEKILKDKYGFETKLLIDAGRFEIHSQLDHFRATLTEKDNFLLYYAGHGELDTKNRRGYWLPVDASADSHVNSIPNYAITDILNNMSVRQAIVIADTCYSGSLTRSAITQQTAGMSREKRIEFLKNLAEKRCRTVLSSGGLKPILDAGPGEHSVFARALLDMLVSNDDILEASVLYRKIRSYVTEASKNLGLEQTPQYAANIHAGHESGDFLFVPSEFQQTLKSIPVNFAPQFVFATKLTGDMPEKGRF
jgi:hypothetical protein